MTSFAVTPADGPDVTDVTTATATDTPASDSPVDTGKHAATDAPKDFAEFTGLADLASVKDFTIEAVEVSQWERTVHIRSMSGKARDSWLSSLQESRVGNVVQGGTGNATAKLLVRCICDAEGTLLLKPQDAAKLGDQDAGALSTLSEVALRLSGLATESVKDAEGNSDTESDASTSD